ncbi:protein lifeguard 2-like isoform X1 [Petromyzon marinus]|uniref:Protein lifeguard 2 n=3 Tax=Petromyzon marinus TaxID=7757 RepID=A0AAJ7SNX2_PETMA|nr:protein lifeguard 2-like isoform X1 [Petromyzon marinus]
MTKGVLAAHNNKVQDVSQEESAVVAMAMPTAPPSYAEATSGKGGAAYPPPVPPPPVPPPQLGWAYTNNNNSSSSNNAGPAPSYGQAYTSPSYTPYTDTSSNIGDSFSSNTWEDKNLRRVFIRKVYAILMLQLLVTFGIVAIFTLCEPVGYYVKRNPILYWSSYAVFLVTYLVLACCKEPRRRFPLNIILLSIFTLAMSYMTGTLASFYSTRSVMLCFGITALVCFSVTIFCFQTKFDFTTCHGLLFVLLMALVLTGLVAAIAVPFGYMPWLHVVYGGLGAVVFTLFLAYDTQLLIGNRRYAISPEEHIFASLNLYMDLVYIFMFLLQIFGSRE